MYTSFASARVLVVIVVAAALAVPFTASGEEAMTAEDIGNANGRFALDLYKAMAETEGNLFISPISVSMALSLLRGGAKGTTGEEMDRVLHFDGDPHPGVSALKDTLKAASGDGVEVNIANRVWVASSLLESYLSLAEKYYGAGAEQLSFADSEKARATINEWVSEQTKKRINELLKGGEVNAATALVLTNAVYFKGEWASRFKIFKTRKGAFRRTESDSVKVPYMRQEHEFLYAITQERYELLELPYKGDRLVMTVVLPPLGALSELEKNLTWDDLQAWQNNLYEHKVKVSLPRFETSFRVTLNSVLEQLGMRLIFGGGDLTGLTGAALMVSLVVHQANIEVNEEGTVAAAATAVVMTKSAPMKSVEFTADRPFIYLIRDTETNAVLFIGRYVGPDKK